MKRLCIYLTYDKQNIVDHYIGYMLKELKTCVNYLVVVCNEINIIRGIDILEKYADDIFYRENRGFDAGGFKDALCNFIGWDKILNYDELILVNDSMFGPFKPMKAIFAEMDNFFVDFWGLTKHGIKKGDNVRYIPEHLQTFFIAIRSKMLHCQEFKIYWENMPWYNSFDETVKKYELQFTQYFSSLGYTYASLADTETNDSTKYENNYVQYARLPYELIKKRNFPFLKKQAITNNTPYHTPYRQTQEQWQLALDYIDKETNYDVNLIWENIIRTLNITDLQWSFHIQYIISSEKKCLTQRKEVVIAVFISYIESAEYISEYLQGLDQYYSIKLFAEEEKILNLYKNTKYECKKVSSLKDIYKILCDYSIVCIVHDTDMTTNITPSYIGKSYFYNIWENLIKDKYYINKIVEKFDTEKKLGFLATPQPNFAEYFGDYGKGWNGNFGQIQKILDKLGINCPISEFKPPFRLASDFWIRGSILKQLENLELNDYEYLPYLWIYFAQYMGYYSGIVESTDFASMNETNLHYYLNRVAYQVRYKYHNFDTFNEMEKIISQEALQQFCQKYSRIFIYGAGDVAKRYKDILPNVECYVISDGHPKNITLDGLKVKYISELSLSDDCGFVICVSPRYQTQIIPILINYGIKNYICV